IGNDQLREQVDEQQILFQAVEEQSLREKLNEFHKGIEVENTKVKSIRSYKKYAIAASIALLLGLGYWLTMGQKSAHEKLYAAYFAPDPGLITPMSATSDYEFYRGMVDYKQGEYELAINRWDSLIKLNPENDTLNFFMGVSYLALEDPSQALPYLKKVSDSSQSIFNPEVFYYLGLAELKEGNTEAAKVAFETNGSEKALEIISKLND
ncbi:MAG TPA: tetratricopeptide repeat protein, partial [Bacteroidetes bacterium]|nr:tetratricopeptide repeat protein [Bacteroidota bacterium]